MDAVGQINLQGRFSILAGTNNFTEKGPLPPQIFQNDLFTPESTAWPRYFHFRLPDQRIIEVTPALRGELTTLFGLREWSGNRLMELQSLTGLEWFIIPVDGADDAAGIHALTSIALTDAQGRPLGFLSADLSSSIWPEVSSELRRQAWTLGLFPLLCLIVVTVFLMVSVVQPLRRVSRALETRDDAPLKRLDKAGPEFSEISQTIRQYFRQQDAIEQAAREKESLARDLHDGIIQDLFGLGLRLKCLEHSLCVSCSEEEKEELTSISGQLNRLIADVRRFIQNLEPSLLEGRSLSTALSKLCEGLAIPPECKLTTSFPPQLCDKLAREEELHLFHMVHELLSNGIRHAKAAHIECVLSEADSGTLILKYQDDGCGFDPANRTAGQGLSNIRDRAHQMGADLEIISRPGGPTVIVLSGF